MAKQSGTREVLAAQGGDTRRTAGVVAGVAVVVFTFVINTPVPIDAFGAIVALGVLVGAATAAGVANQLRAPARFAWLVFPLVCALFSVPRMVQNARLREAVRRAVLQRRIQDRVDRLTR